MGEENTQVGGIPETPSTQQSAPNNLNIWNQWGRTPPSRTKQVSFGRKFTAINATYQFECATRIFGPLGIGWGWDPPEISILQTPEVVKRDGTIAQLPILLHIKMALWHGKPGVMDYGRFYLENTVPLITIDKDGNPHLDDEAYKKIITDTVTKGLSYLGSASDVFLGLFEDSRYVQESKRIEEEKAKAKRATMPQETPPGKQATETRETAKSKPQAQQNQGTGQNSGDQPTAKMLYHGIIAEMQFMDPDMPQAAATDIMSSKLKSMGWIKLSEVPYEFLVATSEAMHKRSEAVAAMVKVFGDMRSVRTALAEAGLSMFAASPEEMMELTDRRGVNE